jgi:hypothetical protein
MSTADFRHATAVVLLSQQPAIPASSAIGSSDGTMILSFVRQLAGQQARAREQFIGSECTGRASEKVGARSADSEQRGERFNTASH